MTNEDDFPRRSKEEAALCEMMYDASDHMMKDPTADNREHPEDLEKIKKVLSKNPDFVAPSAKTETFFMAAACLLPGTLESMLENGADPNKIMNGQPILHFAIGKLLWYDPDPAEEPVFQEVVLALRKHGVDLTLKDDHGETAFEKAQKYPGLKRSYPLLTPE